VVDEVWLREFELGDCCRSVHRDEASLLDAIASSALYGY
jgi:hypothetical protein